MRRLRATFLLRCVTLISSVALFVGVVYLGLGAGWMVGTSVVIALAWLVGIEAGALLWAIEWVLVKRAGRSGSPVTSIWFVDVDRNRARDMARFHDASRDNPTVR